MQFGAKQPRNYPPLEAESDIYPCLQRVGITYQTRPPTVSG